MKKKPEYSLLELSATYEQDDDDCADKGFGQSIKIFTQDGGGGKYFVIETQRWAFNDINEFIGLLRDFEGRVK